MKRFQLLIIFLLPCVFITANAQNSVSKNTWQRVQDENSALFPLSLDECIALGLRQNRAIRSGNLLRISQQFDLKVAETQFDPQLALSGEYLNSNRAGTPANNGTISPVISKLLPTGAQLSIAYSKSKSSDNAANTTLSYQVIQPLLRGAGTEVTAIPLLNARISESINKLALASTISKTVASISYAYRDLLRLQLQEDIAKSSLERSKNLLAMNGELIAAGRMAKVEMIQAEAGVASQEVALEEVRNQVEKARASLGNIISLPKGQKIFASETQFVAPVYADIHQAILSARERQPDFLIQLLLLEIAKNNLVVAKSNSKWDVSLVAGGETSRARARDDLLPEQRMRGRYVGIQFAIPLTDLSTKQVVVQSEVQVQQTQLQIEDAEISLEQKVTDAVSDVRSRWKQYQLGIRAAKLSQQKLEVEKEKLRVGRSSNFQVLIYESDLRNAETSLLTSQFAYLNAITDLELQQGLILDRWQIGIEK